MALNSSILNLVLVRNHGVSFGMLSGVVPWWALILLSLAIVAALAVWLWRSQGRAVSMALGLIIGGALGNVVDRVRFQAVTDFLDFHVAAYRSEEHTSELQSLMRISYAVFCLKKK